MNEPTTPAARVLLLAVRPLGKLADRLNLLLSLAAVFSPLLLRLLDLPWELVLLLVLAVALALVFWAAVRLQGQISRRPWRPPMPTEQLHHSPTCRSASIT